MKKKLGLTLVALLTAFSGIALAAQGDGANNHNGIESQNSTPFLTDSEMKDVVGAWYPIYNRRNRLTYYYSNKGTFAGHCYATPLQNSTCEKKSIDRAFNLDIVELHL